MCYKQEREQLLKKCVLRDEEFCEIKSVCGLLCLLQKSVRLVKSYAHLTERTSLLKTQPEEKRT